MMKFFILFFPCILLAQQKITPASIDKRIKHTEAFITASDTDNFIKENLSILEEANSINYFHGKAVASVNLAYAFNRMNRYKKSIYYLKLLEIQNENTDEDEADQINRNILYSNNYFGIKMYDEALKKLKENLRLSNNIKTDSTRTYIRTLSLIDMATNYNEKKNYDSATFYGKKAIHELRLQKTLNLCLKVNLKIALLNLAGVKFRQSKVDSTEFYLKSARSLSMDLGNNEFVTYKLLGQINSSKKQYDSAIINYKKGIELATKVKNPQKLLELYSLISEAYDKTGQIVNVKESLSKYTALTDSLRELETSNLKETVDLLVDEKQKPLKEKNSFLFYIVFSGVICSVGTALFANHRINKKNRILDVKNEENKLLSQKLNIAFDQVIQLAKNNDPEFLTRFQEVYPDFFPRLLQIQPQLQNSELKFCALLFLNFSSKDIAAYTFVQPQSIQTRKNRLRKRLNISSEEDLYLWMKNINGN
ncbi:tetratricopeptide repeat protein [Chryseobacterium sp. MIQD13]|uniref:tetratricopeptide repeat protein n=1 Tax=Chryseobacterium sp. MIQD13 TaxID=3422310 RepID=UPI003D284B9B